MIRLPAFVILAISIINGTLAAQTAPGTLKHFENFPSTFIDSRNIDVWLPDGYDLQKKYPVLYLQDEKKLFDSTNRWNKKECGVDETLGRLIKKHKIKDCIVVGISNTSSRHIQYFPHKALDYLTSAKKTEVLNTTTGMQKTRLLQGEPITDNYLKFLVIELKPFIDSTFSTLSNQENTFIAGSSLGGLISMYAICEYPDDFNDASGLSTHWPGTFTLDNSPVHAAFLKYMQDHLPLPEHHKFNLDLGTETLDPNYKPTQQQVDKIMKLKGYTPLNWITKEFPGASHTEIPWNTRFYISVKFPLGK